MSKIFFCSTRTHVCVCVRASISYIGMVSRRRSLLASVSCDRRGGDGGVICRKNGDLSDDNSQSLSRDRGASRRRQTATHGSIQADVKGHIHSIVID